MAPLDLQGGTLGERHQHYNKLLKEAIANRQPVADFLLDDTDVEKLLNIDLACHNKDVDYIINVFKRGDMLCVSRALARSTWLVTDPDYAHIINPDYLHTQLFPHMSTKAYIKLIKHIRHKIRDEARAEQFYLREIKLTDAIKWLPRCSGTFIETKFQKHLDHLRMKTFKQLYEKSSNFFEIVMKQVFYCDRTIYNQCARFLSKRDLDKHLDLLSKEVDSFNVYMKLNEKATNIVMKQSPQKILDNFDRYASFVDIPTFSRYLKTDEIIFFLYTQAKKDNKLFKLRILFKYDSLKHFINRLPKTEQFDFVRKIFIDKENVDAIEENLQVGTEPYNMKKLYKAVSEPSYIWYRYASFQRAFEDITRMISKDLDNNDNGRMLTVLMSCANHDLQHIQTLLEYYLDKHKHEQYLTTLSFTTELFRHTNIHQYDDKTWMLASKLFKILKIYDKSNSFHTSTDAIVKSIMIYSILNDQSVPAVIQQQFSFGTLLFYVKKLNKEQKEKIFRYLYEMLVSKFKLITKEGELTDSIHIIENMLRLLRDWQKKLTDYTVVTDKIKECVKIKTKNAWKVSLLPIYNFNKSWRAHMFEESIVMNPCEEVCLNALKHEPHLLQRYEEYVNTLRTNDAVSLRRLLAKLRVYWPHSLARHWTDAYLLNLNRTDGHKATIRGICSSLPQKPLLEFVEKYKPIQATFEWGEIDDRVHFNIQQFIAKNMHIARPQPSPDTILLYAKGDYWQFARPSLLAILYNLNITEFHEHIPKLLDAPVSIQKHGIRFAYQRLDLESYRKLFIDHWKASKNASIRAVIFKCTFALFCHEKDPITLVSMLELIEHFIDDLTYEEDKKIYKLIFNVGQVPLNVRAKYLMKSYKFIKSLIQNVKEVHRHHYQELSEKMIQHSREIMTDMCPDFVVAVIQDFIDKDFFVFGDNSGSVHLSGEMLSVLTAYLLCAKDESVQTEKYEKVFIPIMQRALANWGHKRDGKYIIRKHFQYLLTHFSEDLREYVVKKRMIIPVKMFLNIQDELEKNLSVSENYMLLTNWKLTVTVSLLVYKSNSRLETWTTVAAEIAPEFGKMCLHYLKEDVKLHFPCIYKLFYKVLHDLKIFANMRNMVEVYKSMLADIDFVQSYLTTIEYIRNRSFTYVSLYRDLCKQIFDHPSVEVKMHYYFYIRKELRNPYIDWTSSEESSSSSSTSDSEDSS